MVPSLPVWAVEARKWREGESKEVDSLRAFKISMMYILQLGT